MDANTEIDLNQLHQSIIDAIALQFPDLATVDDYHEERKRLASPACLIELADMEGSPDDAPGTEQLAMLARFEARIIIGFRTANAKREIRKLAAAIGVFIQANRFGQPISPAEVTAITPDDFSPELDQYEVWRIEWQHIIHLGATVWDGNNFPARMEIQLGGNVYDPKQPIEVQLRSGQPVFAAPVDPENPAGAWQEVPAPASDGVLYSHDPDIGVDHEQDYDRLDGGDR